MTRELSEGSWSVKMDKDARAINWMVQYQSMFISFCLACIFCACFFKILKVICRRCSDISFRSSGGVRNNASNNERARRADRSMNFQFSYNLGPVSGNAIRGRDQAH